MDVASSRGLSQIVHRGCTVRHLGRAQVRRQVEQRRTMGIEVVRRCGAVPLICTLGACGGKENSK